jgi:excisionase family DNA binding protein
MASLDLSDDELDRLADRLFARLAPRLEAREATEPERWLDTRDAAAHLGITRDALYKLTRARALPFEQERPGAKCWFKRDDLDAWRRGEIVARAAK